MLKFDAQYSETVCLQDDTEVHFRMVRPGDKDMIRNGMTHLSATSIRRRFFSSKAFFSDLELSYLTEIDQIMHVAIGASIKIGDTEEGVGVARFVRLTQDPEVAEPAVVVLDAFQSRGIGKALLERLHAAAAERGVRWFDCDFLGENQVIQHLLFENDSATHIRADEGGVISARIPVRKAGDPSVAHTTSILSLSAARKITLRLKR